MPAQQSPPWGQDPLSVFFQTAEYNDRVTSLKLETPYALLKRLHAVFQRVETTIEQDNRPEPLVPRFLMVRSHSSFLAAIRLAMSGQLSEAYAVLRVAIEQAWYALHISQDPRPPERVTQRPQHCGFRPRLKPGVWQNGHTRRTGHSDT